MTTILNSCRLLLPSFLWPEKNNAPLEVRNEEIYLQQHFAIGSDRDWIPGWLGTLISYYGEAGLLLLMILLGLLFGVADIIVRRHPSPARIALGSGLAYAALLYEQGPPGGLIYARSACAVAVMMWALPRLAGKVQARRSSSGGVGSATQVIEQNRISGRRSAVRQTRSW